MPDSLQKNEQTPQSLLKSVFGYDQFRLEQENVIRNVMAGKDTLAIMPTGGGKSLCYQIPALLFDGITVVVSPLISLMNDQIDQLQALGVAAVMLNSALDSDTYRANMSAIARGNARLVYMAPETLLKPNMLDFLHSGKVDCITIDEAHCISEWGHEFRPEYRQFADVRRQFPKAVCIALTATATPRVRDDIRAILEFDAHNEFISSFDRPNLFLEIVPRQKGLNQVLDTVERFPDGAGIIYCTSRRQVDKLTRDLQRRGKKALAYHAGLADDERARNQEAFRMDEIQIIVATIAFGMGINKPDVRYIIHYELPKNIESYYQQIGRAGRDGLDAHCSLLFSYGDISKVKYFIEQMGESEQRLARTHLNTLVRFCEGSDCRRGPLLDYFGEQVSADNCGNCDNCRDADVPLVDLTEDARKFLSCMIRTGERFGAAHIADVLRGSKAQKVLDLNHELLSTHGIGADKPKQEWLFLSNLLLQKKIISQDEYGGLFLTEDARPVLMGDARLEGRMSQIVRSRGAKSAKKKKSATHKSLENPEMFDKLRQLRMELARKKRVPAYVVFTDKTLIAMANELPRSKAALLALPGVGEAKLAKFGDAFLALLKDA